jgi:hypothetical protein
MKLKIEGKTYDIGAALERPTLFLVREMKIRTGYGMKSLMEAAEGFEGKSGPEIMDDENLIGALIAMIWLARRTAGEQLTFEEAGSFDMNALEYVEDPELPGALEGPKETTPQLVVIEADAGRHALADPVSIT